MKFGFYTSQRLVTAYFKVQLSIATEALPQRLHMDACLPSQRDPIDDKCWWLLLQNIIHFLRNLSATFQRMRQIGVPKVINCRLLKGIAVDGYDVYVMNRKHVNKKFQIWRINTLYTSDRECVYELEMEELIYTIPCYCAATKTLYVMIVGLLEGENHLTLNIKRIRGNQVDTFVCHDDVGLTLPFEVLGLRACADATKGDMFLYHLSVVEGTIPFWYISFAENTFSITSSPVPAHNRVPCNRFAVCLDGAKQKFVRLCLDNSLLVYEKESSSWEKYYHSECSDLNLSDLTNVKGGTEVISNQRRSISFVESNLSLHSANDVFIAHYRSGTGLHKFYFIDMDEQSRTFRFRFCGSSHFQNLMMYYTVISKEHVVFVGISKILACPLGIPKLKDMALYVIQQKTSSINAYGGYDEGIGKEDLHDLLKKLALNNH